MTEDFIQKHIRLLDDSDSHEVARQLLQQRQAQGHNLPNSFLDLREPNLFEEFLQELTNQCNFAAARPEKWSLFREIPTYSYITNTRCKITTAAQAQGDAYEWNITENIHVICRLQMNDGMPNLKHIEFDPSQDEIEQPRLA
eukprot:TRINITY_DN39096_c0_g1_i1.p1 TRINITY_DN39096_c0_g1~~TRINITY_DN39096_c0_g1_i1.p1  ORF type:complete len:142 (+),score=15.77 TRINITY_DN39096_c0_g1_i1:208-633(+)